CRSRGRPPGSSLRGGKPCWSRCHSGVGAALIVSGGRTASSPSFSEPERLGRVLGRDHSGGEAAHDHRPTAATPTSLVALSPPPGSHPLSTVAIGAPAQACTGKLSRSGSILSQSSPEDLDGTSPLAR